MNDYIGNPTEPDHYYATLLEWQERTEQQNHHTCASRCRVTDVEHPRNLYTSFVSFGSVAGVRRREKLPFDMNAI